jgi:23S rRNA (uracil1939-C5)-methyltransferase|tara:strand:+ start:18 stop:1226 length:1209 start_codon:yes stop_codon:yes gene_type:complete
VNDTLRENDSEKEYAILRLGPIVNVGDCEARLGQEILSVFGGLPGELVKARIYRYRKNKKHIISGIVENVIEASPYRIIPDCPNFGPCSGCQWQHVDYSYQLKFKKQIISTAFASYDSLSGIDILNVIASENKFKYRNHARFSVRFEGQMGFSNRITRRFIKIDECLIMDNRINEIVSILQDKVSETTSMSVRVGVNTEDVLIQPKLLSSDIPIETGQKSYVEKLYGKEFRIASPSFFQVNIDQAEKLIEIIKSELQFVGNEVLVDAYAGVGTFAIAFSSEVSKVIAIEESAAAIKDAEFAACDIANVEFVLGKTENVLNSIEDNIDILILDPSRKGCHLDTIESIMRKLPGVIVYVSCDPTTLARDLNILVEQGYTIKSVNPVDMFPQTYHVECVVIMHWM